MRVLRAVCLIGAILMAASGAEALEKGQSGIGFFGSANIPVFKFGKWYSASPKLGMSYNYAITPKAIAEVEYHYSKMRGGGLEDKAFTWAVDKQPYRSPGVEQQMWFHSFMASALIHKGEVKARGAMPYLTGGVGFFGYSHRVEGLIFPAQTGDTLDQSQLMEPYEDRWAALTFSLGGGLSIASSERFLVDLRLRYNIIMGELRPLEDWQMRKAFPIQALDLLIGFKYFW